MSDAYGLYRLDGAPKLVPSAVLFLDILGTATRRTGAEAQTYLTLTHDAFAEARDWGDSRPGANEFKVVSWFSDNLVMGMPLAGFLTPGNVVDMLAMYAAMHQLTLSNAGLFARGAITFGPFYADAEFVHGPALNEAYDLESRAANGPRVILSPAAMRALADYPEKNELDTYVAAGDDGVPFVDYLRYLSYVTLEGAEEAALTRHRDHIRNNMKRFEANTRLLQKYAWLASYHDARVPRELRVRPDAPAPHFRLLDPA
jgi:hypothetical protein